jgi:hypothetical protein
VTAHIRTRVLAVYRIHRLRKRGRKPDIYLLPGWDQLLTKESADLRKHGREKPPFFIDRTKGPPIYDPSRYRAWD